MKKSKTILAVAIALMALATSCKEEEENNTLTGTVWITTDVVLGDPLPSCHDTLKLLFTTDTNGNRESIHDDSLNPDMSYTETEDFSYTYTAPNGVLSIDDYAEEDNLHFTINGDTLKGTTTGEDGPMTINFYKQ